MRSGKQRGERTARSPWNHGSQEGTAGVGGSHCSDAAECWERQEQRMPVGGDDTEVTLIKAVWGAWLAQKQRGVARSQREEVGAAALSRNRSVMGLERK